MFIWTTERKEKKFIWTPPLTNLEFCRMNASIIFYPNYMHNFFFFKKKVTYINYTH